LRASRAEATVAVEDNDMLGKGGKETEKVDLECPECGTKFQVTAAEAAKGKVRCPKGHSFGVMGLMGGGGPS
jgi:predicted Zn finger-like uncharacterized protein